MSEWLESIRIVARPSEAGVLDDIVRHCQYTFREWLCIPEKDGFSPRSSVFVILIGDVAGGTSFCGYNRSRS
ncbi:hypothetical protein [Variovorax ginsengisoli]|uniref:Uncharacterized protein n=1 Tax=Variovorax ginsengisoli TaxID=363844 RepID=A0ABT9SGE1_9BURK|nr:hypothetical protein [Variovorax ginsengisoli]MDP9902881.1 hypothetical protein [Variovorax ginsengisoli]